MAIGARIVLRPTGTAYAPIEKRSPADPPRQQRIRMLGVHQAGEDPFRLILPIGGHRYVVVPFKAGVLPKRFLETVQRANQRQPATRNAEHPTPSHRKARSTALPTLPRPLP